MNNKTFHIHATNRDAFTPLHAEMSAEEVERSIKGGPVTATKSSNNAGFRWQTFEVDFDAVEVIYRWDHPRLVSARRIRAP